MGYCYFQGTHSINLQAIVLFHISGRAYNITFAVQEIRRIKPVPKLACHSVASWCHPRAPNLDILTCVKDSHIWYVFLPV
jgi:hypothetical protein